MRVPRSQESLHAVRVPTTCKAIKRVIGRESDLRLRPTSTRAVTGTTGRRNDGVTRSARILTLAAVVVGFSSKAEAGPWSPANGNAYHQTSLNFVTLDDRTEYAFTYYVEYGLGSGFAFVGSVPIRFAEALRDRPSGLPGEDFFAFTPNVGLRLQFLDGPIVAALQTDLAIPISEGTFDLTNQLLAGGSAAGGRVFYQVGGGFRLRTDDAGHEALWTADIGVWLGRSILAIAEGRGRYQVEADPRARRAEFENRVGMQWLYRLNDGFDIGVEGLYTFENDTVAAGVSVTGYVAIRTGP